MIFLDNASTTKVDEKYFDIYKHYQLNEYFNPSSLYQFSLEISKKIELSRKAILRSINSIDGNVIFTSSGSESNNTVLKGIRINKDENIVISNAEHPSIYNSAMFLKSKGVEVRIVPVNINGVIDIDIFKNYIDNNTKLVSIIHVNNETGGVNDIFSLCKYAKSVNKKLLFHSDGVQALGKINVNINKLGVDLYSFSGHKIYVPKGIAGLYYKNNINFNPLIHGGGQEFNRRSSTENVGGIISLTESIIDQTKSIEINSSFINEIRNDIIYFLQNNFKCVISNNNIQSPYILCFALYKIKGEVLLHSLEKYNIAIGTGSACSSNKKTTRLADYMKLDNNYKNGLIRLSFSKFTTKDEIEYFKNCFKIEYNKLLTIIE